MDNKESIRAHEKNLQDVSNLGVMRKSTSSISNQPPTTSSWARQSEMVHTCNQSRRNDEQMKPRKISTRSEVNINSGYMYVYTFKMWQAHLHQCYLMNGVSETETIQKTITNPFLPSFWTSFIHKHGKECKTSHKHCRSAYTMGIEWNTCN